MRSAVRSLRAENDTISTRLRNRIKPFVNGRPSANGIHRPAPARTVKPSAPIPAAPPAVEAPAAATNDREGDGRFRPGCKPGPGNPFAKRVAALRSALLDSVSEPDVARLGRKLFELALAGDVAAAKLLLAYLVGKPGPAVDPDRVEVEAWKLILSWPTLAELLASTSSQPVPPDLAAQVIRRAASDASGRKGTARATAESAARVLRRREQEKGR